MHVEKGMGISMHGSILIYRAMLQFKKSLMHPYMMYLFSLCDYFTTFTTQQIDLSSRVIDDVK